MNDFLVTYLDSVDEKLLDYLDYEELRLGCVRRVRQEFCRSAPTMFAAGHA